MVTARKKSKSCHEIKSNLAFTDRKFAMCCIQWVCTLDSSTSFSPRSPSGSGEAMHIRESSLYFQVHCPLQTASLLAHSTISHNRITCAECCPDGTFQKQQIADNLFQIYCFFTSNSAEQASHFLESHYPDMDLNSTIHSCLDPEIVKKCNHSGSVSMFDPHSIPTVIWSPIAPIVTYTCVIVFRAKVWLLRKASFSIMMHVDSSTPLITRRKHEPANQYCAPITDSSLNKYDFEKNQCFSCAGSYPPCAVAAINMHWNQLVLLAVIGNTRRVYREYALHGKSP